MTILYIALVLGAILGLAAWLTTDDRPKCVPLIKSIKVGDNHWQDSWEFDPDTHTDNVYDERMATLHADPAVYAIVRHVDVNPETEISYYTINYRKS